MPEDDSDQIRRQREEAVLDAYRPICLCNKIRKGVVLKAIQAGAKTFEMVRRRTRIGTGPCGAARCGPAVRGLLGEDVATCSTCGWAILKDKTPLVCPRCGATQRQAS
jgi:NAD(P)H-nitrite reductase large subunit